MVLTEADAPKPNSPPCASASVLISNSAPASNSREDELRWLIEILTSISDSVNW